MGGISAGAVPAREAVSEVASETATNPWLAVLILLAAIAAVVGVWLLARWLRRTPGERLLNVLAGLEEVTVLMHPNPDPDAMGCAVAIARIAEHAGTPATIQYPGQIRHQENRAFRTVLDLDLDRITSVEELASDAVVLVDHGRPRGFEGAATVDPVAVIDHHPEGGSGAAFTDVRPGYGACASIVAEYLRDLGATLPDEEGYASGGLAVPPELATGLVYGILSDTKRLTDGATLADFDASRYLHAGVDADLLDRIANPQMDPETLEIKARAISRRDVRPPYAVSDVGTVSNVDAISQAADELSSLETVSAVVVMGDDGETIHLSGRSRDDRVHMGKVIESAVEGVPRADGGGHARMGGGQVIIGGQRYEGPNRAELRDRLFTAMNDEPGI